LKPGSIEGVDCLGSCKLLFKVKGRPSPTNAYMLYDFWAPKEVPAREHEMNVSLSLMVGFGRRDRTPPDPKQSEHGSRRKTDWGFSKKRIRKKGDLGNWLRD
jgi:hypothetical protein